LAGVQGYQLVDVRLYLERPLDDPDGIPEPVAELRAPHAEDVSVLEEIARKGFGLTRFYFDGRFPTERVAEMYAIWIRRSIAGWADAVLVSGSIGQPDGMVTCHLESAGGRIGLLGIDVRARGKGRGRDLLRGVLRWLSHEGVRLAMVATQARNAGAQRLYQRCGFVTTRTSVFYHKWYR
jgi:GNAT superfamily N-acetyltransferase